MGGTGDATGGGLLVVVALIEGVLFKTVLKGLPLPYTCIMLILGVFTGLALQYGECEIDNTYISNTTSSSSSDIDRCSDFSREVCVNPLHRSRAYPSHDNVCHWSPKLVDLGVYAQTVDLWTSIDPHLVMYTFLPPLIYGATVHVNVHVFKKSLGQVLPLAGPGVLLATFLTASFTKLWIGDEYNWSVWAYLTFGAMLSATDPVAVVALLSESSAPQKLGIVIEGESLFNDGTALALFLLCFEGIKGKEEDLGGSIVFFTRLALGGMIMGVLSGKLMLTILKYLQEPLLEVIITLVFSYGTFFVAETEQVHVSGVIALVFLGLSMAAKGAPLLTSEDMMHHFWEMMDFIANTIIFHISGLIIAETVTDEHISGTDWGFLLILFAALIVIRTLTVACLSPMLLVSGYGCTWQELVFVSWSGLRGAVGLALGMIVEATPSEELNCESSFDFESGVCTLDDKKTLQARMLFHAAGIATLTLLVNGTTGEFFLGLLGLERRKYASRLVYDSASRLVSIRNEKKFKEMTTHPFFKSMDTAIVWDHMPILSEEVLSERRLNKNITKEHYERIYRSDLITTFRRRYDVENDQIDKMKQTQGTLSNIVVPTDSSGNSMLFDDDSVERAWPAHWDMFTEIQRGELYNKLWSQIVEQRLRFANMLQANLWHSFENDELTVPTVLKLMEHVACLRDRILRSPARAPRTEVGRANFTTNSWQMLEPQLMPNIMDEIIQGLLEYFNMSSWARGRLYRRISRVLDITRAFIDAHKKAIHTMEQAVDRIAKSVDANANFFQSVHSIHPVVIEMIMQEGHRAEVAAAMFYKEISSGESGMMTRSIATNQAIRQLLTNAEKNVKELHEHGQIDNVEKLTMMKCVGKCRRRLLMNPVFQRPPTAADMLKDVAFLANVDDKEFERIQRITTEKHIHVNTTLFSQDDDADCVYVILSGSISVHYKRPEPKTPKAKKRKGKRNSIANVAATVLVAVSKLKRALSKHKSRSVNDNEESESKQESNKTPRNSYKKKKKRRLSLNDQDILDARHMTNNDIDVKYGMELCRLSRGQVVGSLSLIRNSKRLVTAVARGTMAVVVAIPKSVVGQCFKKCEETDEGGIIASVGPTAGRGGRGRRKNSLWMSGGEKQGVTEVESLSSLVGDDDKLVLSSRSATSTHNNKAANNRMSLFQKAGARLSLFGRRTKRNSLSKRSSSVHETAVRPKRLSLSRKSRKSLTKSKTDRSPVVEELDKPLPYKSKNSYVEGFDTKQNSSSDEEHQLKQEKKSKDTTSVKKVKKQKGRRTSMTDMLVSGLNLERSKSFVEIDKDNIRRMEAALCKEASAIAALIYLRTYFLTMDHEEMLEHFQNGRFVRVPNEKTVVLKDSAILLTGEISYPEDMINKGRVMFLKVDKEMSPSIEIRVKCDDKGNPPRILVLPDKKTGLDSLGGIFSQTDIQPHSEEGGIPQEERTKRSRVFSFFKDLQKKSSGDL